MAHTWRVLVSAAATELPHSMFRAVLKNPFKSYLFSSKVFSPTADTHFTTKQQDDMVQQPKKGYKSKKKDKNCKKGMSPNSAYNITLLKNSQMSICAASVPNRELFEEWAAKKVDLPRLSECFELRRSESLGIHAVARWGKQRFFFSQKQFAPPFLAKKTSTWLKRIFW